MVCSISSISSAKPAGRDFPYGARRGLAFNTITAKHFTGQYHETSLPGGEGLYTFGARWFDPKLARFVSADTIVPDPGVPQWLNRYAYAIGNPLRYTDPSGHMFCEDCTGGAGHYGGGRTGGTGPGRGGGTSGTPTSTPAGCYSVVCLPTSTPTQTPTDTPRPGPGYYPTTPTPTPTPTATPWPYTRTPGRVNVPDLYWGTAYALTVSLPKAVGNPTILHAVGRGAPETLGGPISAMVGLAVSVYPNEIRHVTQGDSVRETVTDVIVDTGGYAFSTAVAPGGSGRSVCCHKFLHWRPS